MNDKIKTPNVEFPKVAVVTAATVVDTILYDKASRIYLTLADKALVEKLNEAYKKTGDKMFLEAIPTTGIELEEDFRASEKTLKAKADSYVGKTFTRQQLESMKKQPYQVLLEELLPRMDKIELLRVITIYLESAYHKTVQSTSSTKNKNRDAANIVKAHKNIVNSLGSWASNESKRDLEKRYNYRIDWEALKDD